MNARTGTRATIAVSDSSTTATGPGIRRVGEHRHDVEPRRRDEHLLQRGQRLQPAGVDAGLLVGLAQRGVHRTVVAGVGRTAGERGLAGVVAQRRRPNGHQQVGVVGQPAGGRIPRTGEQHQHRGVAACAGHRGLRVGGGDHRQHLGGHPPPIGPLHAMGVVDQRFQPGRGGVGSQQTPFARRSSPRHSYLWIRPQRRSRRRWRMNAAGFRQRYRPGAAPPSRASRWVPAARRRSAACRPAVSAAARPARPAAAAPRPRSRPGAPSPPSTAEPTRR